jgi:GntR family transcriptional regulator, transcriptional repressor for pyruvate dehydrogenase complex
VDMVPSPDNGVRSVALAEMLQEKIIQGQLNVGESLPSERDLMVQYTVSRATVREALRVLGAKGLIEVRRGRRGGSYVRALNGETVSKSLDLFIQGHDVRFVDLLAVREAIEPVAAAQAAQFRTQEDLKRINALLDGMDDVVEDIEAFSQLNVHWHLAVVRASHNPLFLSFMTSISSALYSATTREEFDLDTRKIVARTHRKISEAIEMGDADAARRRMVRHVTSYGEELDLQPKKRARSRPSGAKPSPQKPKRSVGKAR